MPISPPYTTPIVPSFDSNHIYDVIIVGAGLQGLMTAYYLIKHHHITNICLIDKATIGGGASSHHSGTIHTHNNHIYKNNFYPFSYKLWQELRRDINDYLDYTPLPLYRILYQQHDINIASRTANIMRLHGDDAYMVSHQELRRHLPYDIYSNTPPILGALCQPNAAIISPQHAIHGVTHVIENANIAIIEHCEAQNFIWDNAKQHMTGIITNHGILNAKKIALCTGGDISALAQKANVPLPFETRHYALYGSEPIKPYLNAIIYDNKANIHIHQHNDGRIIIGGHTSSYVSYADNTPLHIMQYLAKHAIRLIPALANICLHKCLEQHIVATADTLPIIDDAWHHSLYISSGWAEDYINMAPASGYCLAYSLRHEQPHPLATHYNLARFNGIELPLSNREAI